jgi:hypothetical protein
MLSREGRLVLGDGGYAPSGDLNEPSVPETLHALIAARRTRCRRPNRAWSRTRRCSARLHARRPGGGRRSRARLVEELAWGAGPSRAAGPTPTAVGRARPVRVRPGPDLRGRVRDAGVAPQDPPSAPPGTSSPSVRTSSRARGGALPPAYRAAPDDPDSRPLATQARRPRGMPSGRGARQPRPGDGVSRRRWRSPRPGGDRRPARAGLISAIYSTAWAGRAAAGTCDPAARGAWRRSERHA